MQSLEQASATHPSTASIVASGDVATIGRWALIAHAPGVFGSIAFAAFWALLVWVIHHDSPRTLVSFHGLVHAGIAERFLSPLPASFPPENPFFAGEPLGYYWFFQWTAAMLARLANWNIFNAFEAILLAATVTLVLLAAVLGRMLYRNTLSGLLIAFLVFAGTNPLGIVFGILSTSVAFVLFPERLRDDPSYLWGVVHPIYSLIRFNDFGGLYGPLLNFFLNMTSRPLALAGFMGQALGLVWMLRTPGVRPWLVIAIASVGTALFSPIHGVLACGALPAGLGVAWLWRRFSVVERGPGPSAATQLRRSVAAASAVVAGAVVALPTYYHLILGSAKSETRFWLFSVDGLLNMGTIVLSAGPLFCLAIVGLRRAPDERRPVLLALIAAAALLLIGNMALWLPAGNNSNLFHAAVVLLAIPAAASILRPARVAGPGINTRLATAIVLACLPTTLLLLTAYIHRPALPATFDAVRLTRQPADSDLAELYDWTLSQTAPDAVFVVDPARRVTMVGNVAELPAMTGRFLFTEELAHYLVEPYPDAPRRVDIAQRLVSGETPSAADDGYLAALRRQIYIVRYDANPTALAGLEAQYGQPVFRHGDVAAFRWTGHG